MSAPAVQLETRAWFRAVARAGPERWVWPVVAGAWVVLTEPLWGRLLGGVAPIHDHHMAPGAIGMPMHHLVDGPAGSGVWSEIGAHVVMWTAMVLATMLPLVAWNLSRVGVRSPRDRRTVATVDVAVGWAVVWLVTGVVISVAVVTTTRAVGDVVVVVFVGLAVGWQFAAVRRVAVARCHRTFAPPLGRMARRSCVRFGGTLGRDCVVSCWATMAVMTAAGHRIVAVLPLAWLSWRDRRRPHDRPGTAVSVAVLVFVGLLVVVVPGLW